MTSKLKNRKAKKSSTSTVGKSVKAGTTDPKKVTTGVCRSTFMKVTELSAGSNGRPTASTAILIPKDDKKTVQRIKKALDYAAKERFGADSNIFKSTRLKNPLKDGDVLLEDPETNMGDELAGHYLLNAKTYRLPGVVNKQAKKIEDPEELVELCVSGYYFRFTLYFNGYEADTEDGVKIKGVQCMLNNIMFVKEGERLGGGASDPESDFAEFAEDDDDDEFEEFDEE